MRAKRKEQGRCEAMPPDALRGSIPPLAKQVDQWVACTLLHTAGT